MNSILTGEDVVNAMDLRCFGLQARTWIDSLAYRKRDYILIAFSLILLAASIATPLFLKIGEFWVPA